ncbi:methyltransferase domain-containing protein [Streptomyces sp. NPDC056121]|uniref:methyltransferase domain-containing protein n=1 Tax=unclassified Streptomyces TaxID=2593676 RepID=UPI0035DCAC5F
MNSAAVGRIVAAGIQDRKPCHVAAQLPARNGQNPRASAQGASQNAALIAEVVGPGNVTPVDIDAAVTDRATRFLSATGHDRVRVITADAERRPADVVPDSGFDAVIVTVDTWHLPRLRMIAEGGCPTTT